ncbi:DUF1266 domain-containing protein [Ruminococcaceae bacterium OttesenSCG-928-L11]|nr:DUF1266 domain-containing protein [Ruminococcaceae bacterium OttesenSCG-928-L11]
MMRKFAAVILTCVVVLTSIVQPAFASGSIPRDKIYYHYFDGIYIGACRMVNGVPHVNFTAIAKRICSDYTYDEATKTATFTYGRHTGSITVGSKKAYLDGAVVELTHSPYTIPGTQGTELIYTPAWSVVLLLNHKATIATKTAARDVTFAHDGVTDVTIKKGESFYAYNIKDNTGKTNYTKSQLTFMMGLGAPVFLNNLDYGRIGTGWTSDEKIDGYLKSDLYLLTGVERKAKNKEQYRELLAKSWGITSRAELIDTIKRLLENGRGTDKVWIAYDNSRAVMLAQMGCLVGWLTAEEVITYGMQATTRVQKVFTSWEDYTGYYLKAAQYYLSPTGYSSLESRKAYMQYMYKDNKFNGVSWNLNLEEPVSEAK